MAVPPVRVSDPAELTVTSSAAPLATVEVRTEVVVEEPMVVSAAASATDRAARTGAMAVQASRLRLLSPLRAAPLSDERACGEDAADTRFPPVPNNHMAGQKDTTNHNR